VGEEAPRAAEVASTSRSRRSRKRRSLSLLTSSRARR
jgi:hypothetical protein